MKRIGSGFPKGKDDQEQDMGCLIEQDFIKKVQNHDSWKRPDNLTLKGR